MIRYLAFAAILLLSSAGLVRGQETPIAPAAEFSARYSYLHFNAPEAKTVDWGGGWNLAMTANFNHWLGALAEFGGHYGEQTLKVPSAGNVEVEFDSSVHTFLFGPQITSRWEDRVQPFGHVLLGFARIRQNVDQFIGGQRVRLDRTEFPLALALGGGLEFPLGDSAISLRPQIDYLLTRPGGDNFNNLRVSTGVVFRFGRR